MISSWFAITNIVKIKNTKSVAHHYYLPIWFSNKIDIFETT